jgi:E3 ubiquitin-protein ligase RNF181
MICFLAKFFVLSFVVVFDSFRRKIKMASYFDEHNCEPLAANQAADNHILLARLLVDSGIMDALQMNAFTSGSRLAPATSKRWLSEQFPLHCFDESKRADYQCPICLKRFTSTKATGRSSQNEAQTKSAVELPECKHTFHAKCLMSWLEQTSTCPLCRAELETDDKAYEQLKRDRRRQKQRELELNALHDAMFS